MHKSSLSWCTAKRLHGVLAVFWLVMTIPSIIWWSHSVPWLIFVSLYALCASHASAYQASKAEAAVNGSEEFG